MIHLDTSVLVDRLRESARGEEGPATRYLQSVADEPLAISVFVHCELLAGAELAANPVREREKVEAACRGVEVLYPIAGFERVYADAFAYLQRRGESIGLMDLLIGSLALQAGAPLTTRNARHFQRIPGLKVMDY